MQRLPKAIPAAQLTTSAASYYQAPVGTVATINNLSLTNTTTTPVSVSLYRVPSGGSPSTANQFLPGFSISGNQTYVPPQAIGLQLDAGMSLQALAATGAAVTLVGGVYETSGS